MADPGHGVPGGASNRSTLGETSRMWDTLRLDVRHSFRSLRRAPAFFVIVVVTLTVAMGATTAVGNLLEVPNTLWRRALLRSAPSVMPLIRTIAAADSGSGRLHGEGNEPIK